MPKEYTLIHPDIGPAEITAVTSLLGSDDLLPNISFRAVEGGPVHLLSSEFASFLSEDTKGTKGPPLYSCCASSATGALYALLCACGAAGGEVVTASLNYVGIINAILMAGAVPRFVDISPADWCMDTGDLGAVLGRKTKAIVLTHFNKCVDTAPIVDLIRERGIDVPLIQDASLAVGSTLRGIRPGRLEAGRGGATVTSLATSKIITGLGGAVVSAGSAKTIERVLTIAYQGMDLAGGVELKATGANLKMNDMNAVIARAQLGRREELFARRRALKKAYDEHLGTLVDDGRVVLQDMGPGCVVTHYAVLVDNRNALAKRLYEKRRIHLGTWHALHSQRIYRDRPWAKRSKLPVTESVAGRLAFLPFHTRLSDSDVKHICKALMAEVDGK